MKRPLVGALSSMLMAVTAVAAFAVSPASATQRTHSAVGTLATSSTTNQTVGLAASGHRQGVTMSTPTVTAVTFAGTVALSNCSGSVVRMPNSVSTDPALVLSNGHCLSTGFPGPGEVIVNQPSTRSFTLLNASGTSVGTLRASKVAYATMTDTDVSLYQLDRSYAQIQQSFGVQALTISPNHPVQGTPITVVSGFWKATYPCAIDGFAFRLREASWTWKDSVRYTSPCHTIGGTSGSPVVDNATGQVVAVNNTLNEDSQTCTINNPCEVDQNGVTTIHPGIGYAQETYLITQCVAAGNRIDLTLPGCVLPRP